MARKDFIAYTKKRRPNTKVRQKALRKQLCYLKRDIRYINEIIFNIVEKDDDGPVLPQRLMKRFKIINEMYEQDYMYRNGVNKVDSRIVSISQPHVIPIVRGTAGKSVEFGAKISLSLSDGFSFIDNLSWEAFNKSKDLIMQIEKYKERYGYYPESVHADKIYQTHGNRNFCKANNIRITGKPLGRPPEKTDENKERLQQEKKQRYHDEINRIAIEGRFGVAKRKYGLGRIKSKLQETCETDIFISVFVINLDKICAEELAGIRSRYKIKSNKAA